MKLAAALLLVASAAAAQQLALERVTSGLQSPTSIVSAGDTRLFITNQRGQIVIWDGTRLLPQPFLDIQSLVSCCGERGLLSVAFHPDYRANGLFYIDYTDVNGDITVARYDVSSDPNRADPNSAHILFTIMHRDYGNHNGGQLQFGPDGFLYAGTGDGGGGGDPLGNGQNPKSFLAKLLRIDVNASNPQPQIWAMGLRNPWRFSFDRATGELWIADVGQDNYEEVDVAPAGDRGGENYGLNIMEGMHCYRSPCTPPANYTPPVVEYDHSNNACSISGGYVYRGTRFPRLTGTYVYGDYCIGNVWGVTRQNGTFVKRELLAVKMAISTFGEDADGELYVADYDAGVIYRIVDQSPPLPRRRSVSPR